MELSGIELRYLINEIKSKITPGYYISNINAVTKDSFLFKMHHTTEQDIMLMISTRGIWITKMMFKPVEDNDLSKVVKEEIQRSKIESLDQHGNERIVTFTFKRQDNEVRLMVVEFFGDGNIVLCDGNKQILAILNPIEVRHRTLKVGLRYTPPPARGIDVFDITYEQLHSMRDNTQVNELDVLRWIGRNISIPKKFVEEIVRRADIPATKKVRELSDDDITRVYNNIKQLVTDVSTGRNHKPAVILDENGKARDALSISTNATAATTTTTTTPTTANDKKFWL